MFIKRFLSWFKKDKGPVDNYCGVSLSEWIKNTPNELEIDAVGLWQIIATLRKGFRLSGNSLVEHTRQALLALFAKGAQPVVASQPGEQGWRLEDSYGDTPEEKAEAIIQEWLESGEDPIFYSSLWFALPEDITEFSEPGKSHSREKGYPGQAYTLPFGSTSYGMRMSAKNREVMDFSNAPDGRAYLKLHKGKE